MARRSPTNERYGKYTAPSGKTRKSAAAAKPKRASATGTSTSKSSSSSKSSGAKTEKKRTPIVYHPDTPEYKMWRRIWWGFLGAAAVLTTASWLMMRYKLYQNVATILLVGGYLSIAGALYVDWSKMRKLRNEWVESGKAAEAGRALEKEKAEKAAAKEAEKEAKEAEKEQ